MDHSTISLDPARLKRQRTFTVSKETPSEPKKLRPDRLSAESIKQLAEEHFRVNGHLMREAWARADARRPLFIARYLQPHAKRIPPNLLHGKGPEPEEEEVIPAWPTLFQVIRGHHVPKGVAANAMVASRNIVLNQPYYNLNITDDTHVIEYWTGTVMVRCDMSNIERRAASEYNTDDPHFPFFPTVHIFKDLWFRTMSVRGATPDAGARLFTQKMEYDSLGRLRHTMINATAPIEAILKLVLRRLAGKLLKSSRLEPGLRSVVKNAAAHVFSPDNTRWCKTQVEAVRIALQAREDLLELCARVSCLLALYRTRNGSRSSWRALFRDQLEDHVVDGLASTWVCSMDRDECPRAGVWFDFRSASITAETIAMTAVYASAGICMWFRWDPRRQSDVISQAPWLKSALPDTALRVVKLGVSAPSLRSGFEIYRWWEHILAHWWLARAERASWILKTRTTNEFAAMEDRERKMKTKLEVLDARVMIWESVGIGKWVQSEIDPPFRQSYLESYRFEQIMYCSITDMFDIAPAWTPIPGYRHLLMPRLLNPDDPSDSMLGLSYNGKQFYNTDKPEVPTQTPAERDELFMKWKENRGPAAYPRHPLSRHQLAAIEAANGIASAPQVPLRMQDGSAYATAMMKLFPSPVRLNKPLPASSLTSHDAWFPAEPTTTETTPSNVENGSDLPDINTDINTPKNDIDVDTEVNDFFYDTVDGVLADRFERLRMAREQPIESSVGREESMESLGEVHEDQGEAKAEHVREEDLEGEDRRPPKSVQCQSLVHAVTGRFAYDPPSTFPLEPPGTECEWHMDDDALNEVLGCLQDAPTTVPKVQRALAHSSQAEDVIPPGWTYDSFCGIIVFVMELAFRALEFKARRTEEAQAELAAQAILQAGQSKAARKKARQREAEEQKSQGILPVTQAAMMAERDRLHAKETHEELNGLSPVNRWILGASAWRGSWGRIRDNQLCWKLFTGVFSHASLRATLQNPGRVWFLYDESQDPLAFGARPVVLHDPLIVMEVLHGGLVNSRADLISYCLSYGVQHATPVRRKDGTLSQEEEALLAQAKARRASLENHGFRSKDHKFGPADYRQYRSTVDDWPLHDPRISLVAAQQGGLYWRIVHDHLPPLSAFDQWSDLASWGVGHTYTCGNIIYGSECFSPEEEARFTGVFEQASGDARGDHHAKRAYWPRHETWSICSMNTGSWTPAAEEWYRNRNQLYVDTLTPAQPNKSAVFRENLVSRSAYVSKMVVDQGRRRAEAFLESRFSADICDIVPLHMRGALSNA